jgi:hypothetical protein
MTIASTAMKVNVMDSRRGKKEWMTIVSVPTRVEGKPRQRYRIPLRILRSPRFLWMWRLPAIAQRPVLCSKHIKTNILPCSENNSVGDSVKEQANVVRLGGMEERWNHNGKDR